MFLLADYRLALLLLLESIIATAIATVVAIVIATVVVIATVLVIATTTSATLLSSHAFSRTAASVVAYSC